MKFNEQHTVENHIIKFIEDKLDFEYIKPKDFAELRDLESEYIITSLLESAIGRMNPRAGESEIKNIVREVKKIDNNEDFLIALREGINLMNPETRQMQYYKLLDFENPENNHFVVTNQFYFEGNSENIRPDVLIFINGLPLIDIEAKSPTASDGVSFENGIDQIKRYEKVAQKLFIPNCFNIASDGLKTVYGATRASKQYFFQWRDEDIEKELGGELEMSLFSLLSKENLLEIIASKSQKESLTWIEEFSKAGGNFKNLIEELLEELHLLLLKKNGLNIETDLVPTLSLNEIIFLMKAFNESYNLLKSTPIDSLPLEIAIVEFYNNKNSYFYSNYNINKTVKLIKN